MMVKVGIAILALLLAMLASWLVSFVSPGFVRILEETRDHAEEFRRRRSEAARTRLRELGDDLRKGMHAARPAELLSDLNTAINRVQKSVDGLHRLSTKLSDLPTDVPVEVPPASPDDTSGNVLMTTVLVLLTPVVMAVNTFILMEFFQAVLPSRPLLPYPLPEIQIAHVLALLFAIVEVAAGMTIHAFDKKDARSAWIFGLAPWMMICVLSLVELSAYALLSINIDMPTRLAIPVGNGIATLMARYFLAPFGFALTWLLAALGYSLWQQTAMIARAGMGRRVARRLRRSRKRVEALNGLVERATRGLDELQQKARAEFALRFAESSDPSGSTANAQAWAAVSLDFLVTMALLFSSFTIFRFVSYQAGEWLPLGQSALAKTLAIAAALGVGVVGFIFKERLSRYLGLGPSLVSVVRVLQLSLVGLEGLAVLVFSTISAAVLLVLYATGRLVRLLALPGDVVRGLRGARDPAAARK